MERGCMMPMIRYLVVIIFLFVIIDISNFGKSIETKARGVSNSHIGRSKSSSLSAVSCTGINCGKKFQQHHHQQHHDKQQQSQQPSPSALATTHYSTAQQQPRQHYFKNNTEHSRPPRAKAKTVGVYPDLTKKETTPPIPFHPSIEFFHPPSFFLHVNDIPTDRIPLIWDIFIKDDTLVIVFARYLEIYGIDTLLKTKFRVEHSSYTMATPTDELVIENSTTDILYNHHSIDTTITCHLLTNDTNKFRIYFDREPYLRKGGRTSVDALLVCVIPISSIPTKISKHIKQTDINDTALSNVGLHNKLFNITAEFLGYKKTFHLTPIDHNPATPSYSPDHRPNLFISSMVGNKPLITGTEIVTWMQFHRKLGIEHFYLYYMYPLSELTIEHVETLNAYVEKTKASMTIVQWHRLYMNLTTEFVKFQQPRGCSHLAILQSTLYRQKLFHDRNSKVRYEKDKVPVSEKKTTKRGKVHEVINKTIKEKERWMLENDIDDFLIPYRLNCHNGRRDYRDNAMNLCFSNLTDLVENIDNAYAITFANSYFYLINEEQFNKQGKEILKQGNIQDWYDYASKYALRNNFTYDELQDAIIIRDSDLHEHWYRPKLIYNVQSAVLIGPHHAHVWSPHHYSMISGGYYLHYLQNSIGRGFDMIKKPVKTSLYHLSNGILSKD